MARGAEGENVRLSLNDKNGLVKAELFIKESLEGIHRNKHFKIELPERVVKRIKRETGIEYKSHNIKSNSFEHAKKNHGLGGKKIEDKSIPLRDVDFMLAPYIMCAPDKIEKGSTDSRGRESVRFISYLSNGVAVVVEKEEMNNPQSMGTITMWAVMSDRVADGNTPGGHVQNVISDMDAAKIRKNAEIAIERERISKSLTNDEKKISPNATMPLENVGKGININDDNQVFTDEIFGNLQSELQRRTSRLYGSQ